MTGPTQSRNAGKGRFGAGVLVLSGVVLVALSLAAHGAGPILFDLVLERDVQQVHWAGLLRLFDLMNWLGEPREAVGLVVLGGLVLSALRRIPAALVSMLAPGANLIEVAMKHLVERPRPSPGLVQVLAPESSYSFPSGHATFYAAWLGLFVLLAVHRAKPGVKLALSVTAIALVGIAGIARVDVGAHWPTDVIGGYLVGASWALLLWPLARRALSADRLGPRHVTRLFRRPSIG